MLYMFKTFVSLLYGHASYVCGESSMCGYTKAEAVLYFAQ